MNPRRPDPPRATHPYVNLALGHRLYFLTVKYPVGFLKGRQAIDQVWKESRHSNPRGTSLYDVFGDLDLLVRLWIEPRELKGLLTAIHALEVPPTVRVYRINLVSTQLQRDVDAQLDPPLDVSSALSRVGEEWVINRAFQDRMRGSRSAALVKFFVFFDCLADDEVKVFQSLLETCNIICNTYTLAGEQTGFQDYAIYSFSSDERSGCLLTGYTQNWQQMQPAFFELLEKAGISELKSTTLIRAGVNDLEDDRPSLNSVYDENVPDDTGLRLQAIPTILDLDELTADHRLRDRFLVVFNEEDVARSVLAYDARYWWRFVRALQYVCQNIARHHNKRVIAFFMLAYIRMEARLRDLVASCFPIPDEVKRDPVRRDYCVLSKCGILEYEEIARKTKAALEAFSALKGVQGLPKEVRHAVKDALKKSHSSFADLSRKEAYITLGVIPRIIDNLRELRRLSPGCCEVFTHSFMRGWKDNLHAAAQVRNQLMHGEILDVYQAKGRGRSAWQRLLENYVRVYPQVQWIIYALEENLKQMQDEEEADAGAA